MAKTEDIQDISSRIQLLQEKLAKENETRDNIVPQSFGQSKRPSDFKDFSFLIFSISINIFFLIQFVCGLLIFI